MLIELDLLSAVFALLLMLPASMFLVLSSQPAFLSYSESFSKALASDAGMQRLAFQIRSSGNPESVMSLANGTGYSLSRYDLSDPYAAINLQPSRLVVAGGMIYGLSVEK